MLGLSELKQTKVYQEAEQEGRQKEKLETISRLLTLGTPTEQIAQVVNLSVEEVQLMVQQIAG
jgi:predicted transposase/invertase (TIGR01784 family)